MRQHDGCIISILLASLIVGGDATSNRFPSTSKYTADRSTIVPSPSDHHHHSTWSSHHHSFELFDTPIAPPS
eukprot:scaffold38275_cov292-Skeletonema_marinoi.AAC.1